MPAADHDRDTARDVVEVDDVPNLTGLLARAVATSPGRSGTELPATKLVRRDVAIDRDEVAAYADVCGFTLTDALPPSTSTTCR